MARVEGVMEEGEGRREAEAAVAFAMKKMYLFESIEL